MILDSAVNPQNDRLLISIDYSAMTEHGPPFPFFCNTVCHFDRREKSYKISQSQRNFRNDMTALSSFCDVIAGSRFWGADPCKLTTENCKLSTVDRFDPVP
jgi:hypothetical protein